MASSAFCSSNLPTSLISFRAVWCDDAGWCAAGDTIVLRDVGAQREVVLEKEGFEDVVVWNPWIEKAAKTKDFGNEEYKIMMCLEAANAAVYTRGSSIEIPGGGTWTASQRVHVRPIQS